MQAANVSGHEFGGERLFGFIGPILLVVLMLALLWAGMAFFVSDLLNSVPLQEIETVQS